MRQDHVVLQVGIFRLCEDESIVDGDRYCPPGDMSSSCLFVRIRINRTSS